MERYDYDFHCTKLFEEGVSTHRCGDVSIIEQRNDNDCFILDIPAKVEEMFRQNFKLRPEETLLLARDTLSGTTGQKGWLLPTGASSISQSTEAATRIST